MKLKTVSDWLMFLIGNRKLLYLYTVHVLTFYDVVLLAVLV